MPDRATWWKKSDEDRPSGDEAERLGGPGRTVARRRYLLNFLGNSSYLLLILTIFSIYFDFIDRDCRQ